MSEVPHAHASTRLNLTVDDARNEIERVKRADEVAREKKVAEPPSDRDPMRVEAIERGNDWPRPGHVVVGVVFEPAARAPIPHAPPMNVVKNPPPDLGTNASVIDARFTAGRVLALRNTGARGLVMSQKKFCCWARKMLRSPPPANVSFRRRTRPRGGARCRWLRYSMGLPTAATSAGARCLRSFRMWGSPDRSQRRKRRRVAFVSRVARRIRTAYVARRMRVKRETVPRSPRGHGERQFQIIELVHFGFPHQAVR